MSASLLIGLPAGAGAIKPAKAAKPEIVWQTAATAVDGDKVALLVGLDHLKSEIELGVLLVQAGQDGKASFTEAQDEIYPTIKDGLAKAGVADFGPDIAALVGITDAVAAAKAQLKIQGAIAEARHALGASPADVMTEVAEVSRAAAGKITAGGPTPAHEYQEAWSNIMVARSSIDLLTGSDDPAVRDAARKIASALDDIIIIAMPDPFMPGTLEFDPAVILQAVDLADAAAGSV